MKNLKSWLTLKEASDLCLAALGAKLDEADLAQFALEDKLQLSVILFNGARACPWKHSDVEVAFVEMPSLVDGEPPIAIPEIPQVSDRADNWFTKVDTVYRLDEDTPFDLAMIGGERAAVQEILWRGRGFERAPTSNLDGVFLKVSQAIEDGLLGLVDEIPTTSNAGMTAYPLGALPDDSVIVVRRESFESFLEAMTSRQEREASALQAEASSNARAHGEESLVGYRLEPINPLWRLHPYLPIADAAALMAGYEPSQIGRCQSDTWFSDGFPDYWPAAHALTGAVLNHELPAERDELAESKTRDGVFAVPSLGFDPRLSRVKAQDVRAWLQSKGRLGGFFFEGDDRAGRTDDPSSDAQSASLLRAMLDPSHKRYAYKLAATIRAWIALDGCGDVAPIPTISAWLEERALELGLINRKDGSTNKTGIEECAKVANWKTQGGVPKTPGGGN